MFYVMDIENDVSIFIYISYSVHQMYVYWKVEEVFFTHPLFIEYLMKKTFKFKVKNRETNRILL